MPGAPQVTSNGYVSSQPGGVLRFHHGKMTSNYHVRHRQDTERNQKESFQTGSIKNPLNRYSRQIGQGYGIGKDSDKKAPAEVFDVEDGVNPDEVVGPSVPAGALDAGSSALWGYFKPINSFTSICNNCKRTMNLSSKESDSNLANSASPMVQHLMKCLDPNEYKAFIKKRENRLETEKKEIAKKKEHEFEINLKKGPLLTSVVKGAPIWCIFKAMTMFKPSGLPQSENATCMIKGCFKVIRIIRQSATAMIVHLADEHHAIHDIYVEHHKKSTRELSEILKEHEKETNIIAMKEKSELLNKANDKPFKDMSLSNNTSNNKVAARKRRQEYEEDEKITREQEHFSNPNSTLRGYFTELGILFAKCKHCHNTLKVEPLKEDDPEPCKMEQHLKQKHFKDYDVFAKKKEENKARRVEKIRRKQAKMDKKEYKESEEGKEQKERDIYKKLLKEDAKDTINRFTGTGNMMWKHFHQMPNSEFVKCKICHRVFRRYKNSLGDTTVKLLEHMQEYHKDQNDLFAL